MEDSRGVGTLFSNNNEAMSDNLSYTDKISQQAASSAIFEDIHGNEKSVQPFTQLPATGKGGVPAKDGLCAEDLFYQFTAGVMMEEKIFTR